MLHFWNGNKSPARQEHELQVLQAALGHDYTIRNDTTDYPSAEDEGRIFQQGADLLVTVAGNPKFAPGSFRPIPIPLARGLLGCRILIIRQQDQAAFSRMTQDEITGLKAGIPMTWADAGLMRHNRYGVLEKGTLETIFTDLKEGLCDYVSLGANEIQQIFAQYQLSLGGLAIEQNLMLFYPMPLLFYVTPDNPQLADLLQARLAHLQREGELTALFDRHYGQTLATLRLASRRVFNLQNPLLDGTSSDLIQQPW